MTENLMKYFKDTVIKVNRDGSESKIGKLLDERDDYIAVLTEEDGVVYYKTQHIKSFTENTKGKWEFDVEIPENFKNAEKFKDLLKSLKYHWVKINRGGSETVNGVLCEVKDDFVHVVANEELVRIPIFYINNVSYRSKN
ncbi:hypothetical protein HFZ78_28635 [Priestia megaterium]|uniref:Spore coat protein B n=1 Tax=Priestia megaterium TaxID=1404 RepID=A0A6H1P9X6_PRIMG|nr:hypothetical protein [Priestia megaterium]QIZ10197.1 hypothetical protein HFZ78_28635 [Priestia megaterium]